MIHIKAIPLSNHLWSTTKCVSVPSACIFLFSLLCSGFFWVSILWQWVCSPRTITVWGQENTATRLHLCLCLSFCSQPFIKSKEYVCLFDWGWNWATDTHRADKQKSRQDQVSTSAIFTPNLEDFVEALVLADSKAWLLWNNQKIMNYFGTMKTTNKGQVLICRSVMLQTTVTAE